MKTFFKTGVLFFLMAALINACTKDESKIYLQGGTAPVLTASDTSAKMLTRDKATQTAVVFSWTNPDYTFNTGVSSQTVVYLVQIDTAGNNFKTPQEVAVSGDLSKTFTDSTLNAVLSQMDLKENIPHNVEFRIKATLGNSQAAALYSNVIGMVITPYLDVVVPVPPTGELYITGSGTETGWTNFSDQAVPDSQKFVKKSTTEYYIDVEFSSGGQYKFLSTKGFWQPQYGVKPNTSGDHSAGGDLGYNFGLPGQSDPDAINTPSVAGTYRVSLNFKTGKYTVTKK